MNKALLAVAASIPPQRPPVLRSRTDAIPFVRADEFDPPLPQSLPQRIAVVGLVGDHPHRLLPRPTGTMKPSYAERRECRLREPDFRRDAE
jgi:hypothetical protein